MEELHREYFDQTVTKCKPLLQKLEKIWNNIGLSNVQREEQFDDLVNNVVELHNQKLSKAVERQEELKLFISDSETELDAICSAMNESSTRNTQTSGSLMERYQKINSQLDEMRKRKAERLEQFEDVRQKIQGLTDEMTLPSDKPAEVSYDPTQLSTSKLKDLQQHLQNLQDKKNKLLSRSTKKFYFLNCDGSLNEEEDKMTWGVLARDHEFLYVDGFTTTQPCPDKLSSSDDAESNGLYAAVCKAKELYDKEKLESGSDGVFVFIFSDSLANVRAYNKGIFQHYFGRDVKINPELTNQCRKHLGLALWASERKLDTSGNKPAMHSRIVVSYIPKNFNKIADFFSKVKLEEGLHMKYKEAHLTNKVKNLLVRERNLPAWRLILEKAEINAEKEKQKANASGQKGKQQPLPVWVEKGDGKKHKIAEGSEEKIEGSERGKKKILDEENKRSVQKEKVHGGWMWKEKASEGKKRLKMLKKSEQRMVQKRRILIRWQ